MLDGMLGLLGYLAQIYFVSGKAPEPVGTKHPSIVPYGAYPTEDGHVIAACLTENFWHNFARALDLPDLATDPRFSAYEARLENRVELEAIIETRMRTNNTEYWLAKLEEFDVPSAPILDIGQALEQPHTRERDLIAQAYHPTTGDLSVVRTPIRFGGAALDASCPPPLLGEQTSQVLKESLGMSDADISGLIENAVIFQQT